jgi:hypothetical protein
VPGESLFAFRAEWDRCVAVLVLIPVKAGLGKPLLGWREES